MDWCETGGITLGTELLKRARDSAAIADLPEDFRWALWFSPENLRAFRGAISAALSEQLSDEAANEMLEDWRATAELDAAPEALAEIRRAKEFQPPREIRHELMRPPPLLLPRGSEQASNRAVADGG